MENITELRAFPEEAVRGQVDRVLKSRLLISSHRLCRFLRFVVDHSLKGTADQLKESLIGSEVYDRKGDYDPGQDSIVRTESRRLRNKLKEYYETEGKNDPIVISFRLGSYAPLFRAWNGEPNSDDEFDPNISNVAFTEGDGIVVAVLAFVDLSGQPLSDRCARDLTDELVHELNRTPGVRVVSATAFTSPTNQTEVIPELAEKLGVQLIFEGTVREEAGRLRVISRLVNLAGLQVCSQKFETKADTEGLFVLTERLASTLVHRIRPEQSVIRRFNATISQSLLSQLARFLSAEQLLDEGTTGDIQRALVMFGEVEKSLPTFARPLCGVAQCRCAIALRGVSGSSELLIEAKTAAQRAMNLDPDMIMARVAMAFVQMLQWDWSGAEVNFQYALNSGDHARAFRQFGLYLTALGRFDEAFHYLTKAQQIDPFSGEQKVTFAKFFFLSSRAEDATEHFSNQAVFGVPPPEAEMIFALFQVQQGKPEEALRLAHKGKRDAGAQPGLIASVAEVMSLAGEAESAKPIIQSNALLSKNSPVSHFRQALLLLSTNDRGGALAHLTQGCAKKEAEMIWLRTDPRLRPLHEVPEFRDLLAKVMPPSNAIF